MTTQDRAALESAEKAIREALADPSLTNEPRKAVYIGSSDWDVDMPWTEGNARLAAACSPAAMALILAELDRLRAERDEALEEVKRWVVRSALAETARDSLRAALAGAPAARPEPRQPLTDEQIRNINNTDPITSDPPMIKGEHMANIIDFARAVELAHGIGAAPAAGEQKA